MASTPASTSTKLPVISPFESPESIVQALQQRDAQLLQAGLVQLEKRSNGLVNKAAPRADKDVVLDYLTKYPTTDGVFQAWDVANKTNNSQLSAAVLNCLTSLIRLLSTDPFLSEPELIRRLLSQYSAHLERALNPGRNDVTTAALKLLNVVVGFGSGRFGRRALECMSWNIKITSRLYRTRLNQPHSALTRPSIRTLLSLLTISFLSLPDNKLKSHVLDTKGLVSGLIKGLNEDPEEVVDMVLNGLWGLLSERGVSVEKRRDILDESIIAELVKLYATPSRHSIHRFFHLLTLWLSPQIISSKHLYSSSSRPLTSLLKNLHPTEDADERELTLFIIRQCPNMSLGFWEGFTNSLEPRGTSRWISSITLAVEVVGAPVIAFPSTSPEAGTTNATALANPPPLNLLLSTILPPSLTKTLFTKSLQNASPLVSFLSSLLLLTALQKATKTLEGLARVSQGLEEGKEGRWRMRVKEVRESLKGLLPDPGVVVNFLMSSGNPAVEKEKEVRVEKGKKRRKVTEDVAMDDQTTLEATPTLHPHLRTNIALRLLYLYHRVVPSQIATLSFDFAKLPQSKLLSPTSSTSSEFSEQDAQGIKALSLSYAIRLASAHSEGIVWGRPGDHFKTTLQPLFKLFKTPSTKSNRRLLESILERQMAVGLLFGEGDDANDGEAAIWLHALPVPSDHVGDAEVVEGVLTFFEGIVLKTLTRPIKPSPSAEDDNIFSPLLRAVLETVDKEPLESVKAFLRKFVLGYIGLVKDLKKVVKLVETLGGKAGRECVGWIKVLEGGEVADVTVHEALAKINSNAPLPEVLLQVSAAAFSISTLASAILPRIATDSSWSSSVQILLHRLSSSTESDAKGFVSILEGVVASCPSFEVKRKVKTLICEGTLWMYRSGSVQGVESLLSVILDAQDSKDAMLAQPFVSVLVDDLAGAKPSKKSKKVKTLPDRLYRSTPLVPFFSDSLAISFASIVLDHLPADTSPSEDTLVTSALERLLLITDSTSFQSMWATNLIKLCRLSESSPVAGRVLARGAEALSPLRAFSMKHSGEWKPFVGEWLQALLGRDALDTHKAKVLAALIYRSESARVAFRAWISARVNAGEALDGAESALLALLEVGLTRGEEVAVSSEVIIALATKLLNGESTPEEAVDVVKLACKSSEMTLVAVVECLKDAIPKIDRDGHLATAVHFLSTLAQSQEALKELLEDYLNGCFAGLVRRFVEDEEDSRPVLQLVGELIDAASTIKLSYKTHLLEPLITAVITKRLDQEAPVALAAILCRDHQLKANEVTRHLNSVFANSHFRPARPPTPDSKRLVSLVVQLVTNLANSSISAACSTRFAERLMPFYGGSLSAEDVALLSVFRRMEAVGGLSLSIASKHWNPSIDDSPLEETKIGSLAVIDKAFVRRSWLRACASKRTPFPKEHAEISYDPHFLIPYLSHLIAEDELKPQDWITILESDVLALGLAALASSDETLCTLARLLLGTALAKLESIQLREKDEMLLVLTHAKNCIFSSSGEAIPSIIALFLASSLHLIANPSSPLYPPVSRFLLQRSLLDQRDVPMFYLLFYSTSDEPEEDRTWLFRFLGEGLVRSQDWRILRRRQVVELLASYFENGTSSVALRGLVLQFLLRASTIPQAARELISRNGIFNWIATQRVLDPTERRLFITIISNLLDFVPLEKPDNAVDALNALNVVCGDAELTLSDASTIISLVARELGKGPSPVSHSAAPLTKLDRLSSILFLASARQSSDPSAQSTFYHATMALAFAKHEAGVVESKRDRELFSLGVKAGLEGRVEGLWKETVRSLSE